MIPEWKKAWRFTSVQLAAVLVALDLLAQYQPELKEYIGDEYARYLGVAIIIARVMRQAKLAAATDNATGGDSGGVADARVARSAGAETANEESAADAGSREDRP